MIPSPMQRHAQTCHVRITSAMPRNWSLSQPFPQGKVPLPDKFQYSTTPTRTCLFPLITLIKWQKVEQRGVFEVK